MPVCTLICSMTIALFFASRKALVATQMTSLILYSLIFAAKPDRTSTISPARCGGMMPSEYARDVEERYFLTDSISFGVCLSPSSNILSLRDKEPRSITANKVFLLITGLLLNSIDYFSSISCKNGYSVNNQDQSFSYASMTFSVISFVPSTWVSSEDAISVVRKPWLRTDRTAFSIFSPSSGRPRE